MAGNQSFPYAVGIELRQECDLFLLFFIVYLNWIDKCNQADVFGTIGNSKISCLLCADDLILILQNLAFGAHYIGLLLLMTLQE